MAGKLILTIVIASLSLMINSCEKRVFDYRNKYCGDYFFEVDATQVVDTEATQSQWKYDGKVFYDKEDDRELLRINYSPTTNLTVRVSKGGTIFISANMALANGEFYKRDSLHFSYTYVQSPATSTSVDVRGIRKK